MQLNFDQKIMEEAFQTQANSAIKSAFEDYEIQKVMRESVINSVLKESMIKAVNLAASKIDVTVIAEKLAVELGRTIVSSTIHMVEESLVNTLLNLRGLSSYDGGYKEEKAKILAEIQQGAKP